MANQWPMSSVVFANIAFCPSDSLFPDVLRHPPSPKEVNCFIDITRCLMLHLLFSKCQLLLGNFFFFFNHLLSLSLQSSPHLTFFPFFFCFYSFFFYNSTTSVFLSSSLIFWDSAVTFPLAFYLYIQAVLFLHLLLFIYTLIYFFIYSVHFFLPLIKNCRPVRWGCRIHGGKTPPTNEWSIHNTIQSDGEAPFFELRGMWNTSSLPLLPGRLRPIVEVPVRVPSMSQIELFNDLTVCKQMTEVHLSC